MTAIVLYRGPLERSRVSFLTESVAQAYGKVKLVWICPRSLTRELVQHWITFIASTPWIEDWEIMDGTAAAALSTVRRLRGRLETCHVPLIAIGFSAVYFAALAGVGPYIWCINGVPEEADLQAGSPLARLQTRMWWYLVRALPLPAQVVTVSRPMSCLVERHLPGVPTVSAPNCVDAALFSPPNASTRKYIGYLGTGAEWQGLDRLASVWGHMVRLDPALRFRVISRDPRTRVLSNELPPGVVEFVAAEQPEDVAELLWEVEAGFLLRQPHLVNNVSFPTKFGEYIAAGAYPVLSTLDWDLTGIARQTGCGLLVSATATPAEIAHAVIAYRSRVDMLESANVTCRVATYWLSRERWVAKLASALGRIDV